VEPTLRVDYLKDRLHWRSLLAKLSAISHRYCQMCAYVLLALPTLGAATDIGSFLFYVTSPRGKFYKPFWPKAMPLHNKLVHLSLASLSSLVKCLWVKPGAYPRGASKGCFTRVGSGLPANNILGGTNALAYYQEA
jgi:hypothetical protein